MRFKKNKVWQALDDRGRPVQKDGKVLIKYQLEQAHRYWVNPANLVSVDAPAAERPATGKTRAKMIPEAGATAEPGDAIQIYTDGASSGNPGPAGIGVIMVYGGRVKEISRFIGDTTNNVAELEAIRAGLLELKRKNLPVIVYTDSSYAHGVLSLGWKARKNLEIVQAIRRLLASFKNVKFVKVPGHAGHPQNERADRLARQAIETGRR